MDEEIVAFRNEVTKVRGKRRQGAGPFPAAMRARGVRLFKALRERGLSREAAAKQVGITATTLNVWQESSEAKLVPVRVVPEAKAKAKAKGLATPVRLLSPRGYRVEVPDVASAVALLRELG